MCFWVVFGLKYVLMKVFIFWVSWLAESTSADWAVVDVSGSTRYTGQDPPAGAVAQPLAPDVQSWNASDPPFTTHTESKPQCGPCSLFIAMQAEAEKNTDILTKALGTVESKIDSSLYDWKAISLLNAFLILLPHSKSGRNRAILVKWN